MDNTIRVQIIVYEGYKPIYRSKIRDLISGLSEMNRIIEVKTTPDGIDISKKINLPRRLFEHDHDKWGIDD